MHKNMQIATYLPGADASGYISVVAAPVWLSAVLSKMINLKSDEMAQESGT